MAVQFVPVHWEAA